MNYCVHEWNIVLKTVVIYANCQGRGIEAVLSRFLEDAGRPHRFIVFENYTLLQSQAIDLDAVRNADVFIYQPINDKYGEASTSYLLAQLKEDCISIAFPYVYNDAFWIFVHEGHNFKGREAIDALRAEGRSILEVLTMYQQCEIDFQQTSRFQRSILLLKEKERACDVTISDFILDEFKKQKLFFTQNHPTTAVFVHLVNQMLPMLGFKAEIDGSLYPNNLAGLRGEWFHTEYDLAVYGFEYPVSSNESFYQRNIIKIYYDMCASPHWVNVEVISESVRTLEQRMLS